MSTITGLPKKTWRETSRNYRAIVLREMEMLATEAARRDKFYSAYDTASMKHYRKVVKAYDASMKELRQAAKR